eukprot:scaffold7637_cov258-Pinguiococcus_pyrenoidosus.AAC.1
MHQIRGRKRKRWTSSGRASAAPLCPSRLCSCAEVSAWSRRSGSERLSTVTAPERAMLANQRVSRGSAAADTPLFGAKTSQTALSASPRIR